MELIWENKVVLNTNKYLQMLAIKSKYIFAFISLISFSCFANGLNNGTSDKSNIQCKIAKVNEAIHYTIELKNTGNTEANFSISIKKEDELACSNSLSVKEIILAAKSSSKVVLSVVMSDRIPVGGQESSFVIIENKTSKTTEELQFISVHSKPHPFLFVTDDIIEETKSKVENYDWAKGNLTNMLDKLDKFKFPKRKVVSLPRPTKVWSSLAYNTSDGEKAFQMCLAWKLTGNTFYRDKVIKFIKDVCDKEKGYLSIGAATTGVQVHEGNFFLFLAAACDVVYNESSFSEEDRENINATFRYYLELNRTHMSSLGIMNHQASANAGAIVVALFLQDMAEVKYLTEADGGMGDQIAKGVMADGWWFEGTANYCYLVTQRYTLVAQAFENYGLDLYHRRFPTKVKSKDFENAKEGYTGMKFDIWGPTGKSTRGVEDMVTPYVSMMDEDGFVVSSNDSNLKEPNEFYELAYREYGIEKLAWVINKSKRDSWVSLMYGVAELPVVKDPRSASDFVANVGLVALRSQKEAQDSKEQIQAYLKYGSHGGWHGHFDRTGLVALDRYGHKFFGTEMVWFGYGHKGYKESVQTSASHNMVVVDELQQEAVPSKQTLFFKGKMMQVSALETNARWRKIPTGNPDKFPPWDDVEIDADFKKVHQKRLSIVTDDYVVIADFMNAPKKHTYDWLLHPIGLQSIEGAKKTGPILETVSVLKDSPYKYFKQGQWYEARKGAKVQFIDNGVHLDVHSLWPKKAKLLVANYPNGGKIRGIRNNPERKTYGVRVHQKQAQFLHVLEPYKGKSQIVKIVTNSPNELTVYLLDGREQKITISNLATESLQVNITESKNGKVIRSEKAN